MKQLEMNIPPDAGPIGIPEFLDRFRLAWIGRIHILSLCRTDIEGLKAPMMKRTI
jgi:hypothetical protein